MENNLLEAYKQEHENLRTFEDLTLKVHISIITGILIIFSYLLSKFTFLSEIFCCLPYLGLMLLILIAILSIIFSYFLGKSHVKRMERIKNISKSLGFVEKGIYKGKEEKILSWKDYIKEPKFLFSATVYFLLIILMSILITIRL